jgi:hypothetical protein
LVSQLRETCCCAHHKLALGVFQQVFWCQLHTSETTIKLPDAIAGEKEDFCKGSLSLPIFYFVIVLVTLFLLASFYQKYKKISSFDSLHSITFIF